MENIKESLSMSREQSHLAGTTAEVFGFMPKREEWFRYREDIYYEMNLLEKYKADPESVPKTSWQAEWMTIEYVTDYEAREFAEALDKGYLWYAAHPGEVPDWYEGFPKWDWNEMRIRYMSQQVIESLPTIAEFMRGGAFQSVTVTPYPWSRTLYRTLTP